MCFIVLLCIETLINIHIYVAIRFLIGRSLDWSLHIVTSPDLVELGWEVDETFLRQQINRYETKLTNGRACLQDTDGHDAAVRRPSHSQPRLWGVPAGVLPSGAPGPVPPFRRAAPRPRGDRGAGWGGVRGPAPGESGPPVGGAAGVVPAAGGGRVYGIRLHQEPPAADPPVAVWDAESHRHCARSVHHAATSMLTAVPGQSTTLPPPCWQLCPVSPPRCHLHADSCARSVHHAATSMLTAVPGQSTTLPPPCWQLCPVSPPRCHLHADSCARSVHHAATSMLTAVPGQSTTLPPPCWQLCPVSPPRCHLHADSCARSVHHAATSMLTAVPGQSTTLPPPCWQLCPVSPPRSCIKKPGRIGLVYNSISPYTLVKHFVCHWTDMILGGSNKS